MLHDTVVIEGEVSLINQIDGDPDVCIGGGGSQPTGTKSILLTEAGTKTEDVTAYASAEINAVTSATASGAVASFSDGAEDVPMDSCVVDIEPVQNLNGQTAPYPAGGSANIWNEQWEQGGIVLATGANYATTKRWRSDYISVTPSTAYYCKSGANILMFFYDTNKGYLGNSASTSLNIDFMNKAFMMPSTTYYVRIASGVDGTGVYNNDTSINYPSTDHDYHPYSNICPISGWSEVNVNVTGVNVWDEQWENGSIQTSTGEKASGSNVISKNYIPVRPNTTFSTTVKIRIFFYKADKTYISYVDKNAGTTFTTPSECYYLLMTAFQAYGSTYNHDISINYPSTDTTYHAYTGTSYPISLGQTVYGGTLDVVTGVLTVDKGLIVVDGDTKKVSSVAKSGATQNYYSVVSMTDATQSNASLLANMFKYNGTSLANLGNIYQLSNGNIIFVQTDQTLTTVASVNAWLAQNPLQISYLLGTEQTIQLTPTEVKTLLGSNSVWADSGNISVGYKADIFLYADSLETIIDTLTGGA